MPSTSRLRDISLILEGVTMPNEPLPGDRPILFFDGVCGLCTAVVDFVMRHDSEQRFLFATLQGPTASATLGIRPGQVLDTVIVVEGSQRFERSDAALRIARHLGWPWRALSWLKMVPRPLRDAIYGWVARNRYGWFGKKQSCRMPTPAERARFLA